MAVEPISLAAFVTSILANSAKVISQIHNVRETYKDAPEDFGYLHSEIIVVHKLLEDFQGRCDAALNNHTYPGLEDKSTAGNDAEYFMTIANAVNSTLKALQSRTASLLRASAPFDAQNRPIEKPKSKDVFKYIWDEKEINKLVQRLQGHKTTLTLVLAQFADQTNEDIRRRLIALQEQQALSRPQVDGQPGETVRGSNVHRTESVITYNSIRETTPFAAPSPVHNEQARQASPTRTSSILLSGNSATINASAHLPQSNASSSLQEIEKFEADGRIAYNGKEWSHASHLLKRAIEARENLGHDEGSLVTSRTLYAEALYMDKQYGLAREHFVKLVQWAEINFGQDHQETAKRRMSLAHAAEAWGSASSAREEFKAAALGFERASGGADSLDSLRCRYKYGVLLTAAGKDRAYDRAWPPWEEAEGSLKRAADGLSHFLGPEHDECFRAKVAHGQVLLWMCRDRDAHLQLMQCLQCARQKRLARDHEQVTRIQSLIDDCSYWLKHPKEAKSPHRLQISKQREARRTQSDSWRKFTGHW